MIRKNEKDTTVIANEVCHFLGGWSFFYDYLQKKLITIDTFLYDHGRIYLQFRVSSEGSIIDIEFVRGMDSENERLRQELTSIFQNTPKWIPTKWN